MKKEVESCNSEPPSVRSEQDWNSSNLYAKKPDLFMDKELWSVSRLCTAFEVWRRKDLSKSEKVKRINGAKISRNMERKLGSTISQQLSSFVSEEEARKHTIHWNDVERLYNFCGPYLSLPQANIAGFLDLVAGQFKETGKDANELVDKSNIEPNPGNRVEASLYGSRKGESLLGEAIQLKSADGARSKEPKLSPQHKRARTRTLLDNNHSDPYGLFSKHPETSSSRKENLVELMNSFTEFPISGNSSSSASKFGKDGTTRKDLSSAWEIVSSTVHSYRLGRQQEILPSRKTLESEDVTESLDARRSARNILEQVLSMDTGIVKWCLMEFFDSYVDYAYLNFSEFSDVLEKEMGIDANIVLNTREWRFVRKAMCNLFSSGTKPRRLSKKFLEEERQRLWSYRNLVRQYLMSSQPVEFYPWAPCPSKTLSVGSKVIARNWLREEVYSAYVVTFNPLKEEITVKFDEAQLSSSSIKDTDVMVPNAAPLFLNEDETTASSHWTKDSPPSAEYLLKKLQSLQAAEEELATFNKSYLQGHHEAIWEILKRKSQIASLNLECDELFLQTFPHIRDCHDLKYISQVSKVLLRGLVGDDDLFRGKLEPLLVSLISVLVSAFQVINFSSLESSEQTSHSLLISSVQSLEKFLTDENKQSFAILTESARQLNSSL